MNYRELMFLRAVRKNGIVAVLATSPSTPAEVVEETGITERAASISLEALVELGFLTANDGTYEATDRLRRLHTDDVVEMSSLAFRLDGLERWITLPETMYTNDPVDPPENYTNHYMGAMHDMDEETVRACVTAAVHQHPDAEQVADVGGGPGAFAREFVKQGREVTLVDRPDVIGLDEQLLDSDPISLVEGDIRETVPGEHDLVFCSRVFQTLSPEENRRILNAAYDALSPDGSVVLIEVVRGRSPDARMFGVTMLAQADSDGNTYTESQYRDWFHDAGFEDFRVADVPGTKYQTVAGDR